MFSLSDMINSVKGLPLLITVGYHITENYRYDDNQSLFGKLVQRACTLAYLRFTPHTYHAFLWLFFTRILWTMVR